MVFCDYCGYRTNPGSLWPVCVTPCKIHAAKTAREVVAVALFKYLADHEDAWDEDPLEERRRWLPMADVAIAALDSLKPVITPYEPELCRACDGAGEVWGDRNKLFTCPQCLGTGYEDD